MDTAVEKTSKKAHEILTGDVFGKLTVTSDARFDQRQNYSVWICEAECSCGSPKRTVYCRLLVNSRTVSCGCVRKRKHENFMKRFK
jgi:hypothetical protein